MRHGTCLCSDFRPHHDRTESAVRLRATETGRVDPEVYRDCGTHHGPVCRYDIGRDDHAGDKGLGTEFLNVNTTELSVTSDDSQRT